MQYYNEDEALRQSVEYFGGDELAASVFLDKYALRDNEGNLLESTPEQMFRRLAKEFVRIEKTKFKIPLTEDEIFGYLDHFKYIVPQGSVLFGVGNPYQYVSLSNCFLVESPKDSYSGIIYTDEQLVSIAKRRGGNGVNISNLRPEGAVTKNAAKTSTGIVPFMGRFSNTIREVGQGGRRGALMISLFDKHPQIMDFINAKQDLTKVTGANISVQISDELMNAIKKDKDYILKWPVDSNEPIIRKKINARELWDALITQARNNAEPGVLFWDTIIKESPADCYASLGFRTQGTNPCSEIPLSELDSCRLILINLYSYIIDPFTDKAKFDYEKFSHDAIIMQRLADDIIDLEIECIERIIQKIHKDPESIDIKIRELNLWEKVLSVCRIGRRTGCGITALGDVFAAKGIAYGSEESIRITKKIYKILKLSCYRSSVDMSKEISSFPIYDMTRELENPFIQRIAKEDPELYDDMVRFGRRNIALLTTAPAGSMSILTQTTSGIEPLFQISYKRRKKIVGNEKDVKVDFVDASGDKWREFEVMHSKILEWRVVTGEKDIKKSPWYKCCAEDLAWEDRLLLQSGAQQHVDHAISSTLNLPENVTIDTVKNIYMRAWELGLKGVTVYRKNSRSGVLIESDNKSKLEKTADGKVTKRPKELLADIHHIKVRDNTYFVAVGMLEGSLYEVFSGKNKFDVKETNKGKIVKVKRGHYKLLNEQDEIILENIVDYSKDEEEALTRMVSTCLRHGVDLDFVVQQCEKINGDMQSFSKSLARALKKYIPDGTVVKGTNCKDCGGELRRNGGCYTCHSCGNSTCM